MSAVSLARRREADIDYTVRLSELGGIRPIQEWRVSGVGSGSARDAATSRRIVGAVLAAEEGR